MSDCGWIHTDVAAFFWFHGVINGAWDVHSAPQLREKWVDYLLFERNSRRIELQMGSNGYSGRKSAAYILPIKPVDPVNQSKQEVSRENNRPCSICGRSNDVVHKQRQKKLKIPQMHLSWRFSKMHSNILLVLQQIGWKPLYLTIF